MNKELQTISMLVIDIVEKAYSNNCKHHEGTYQIQIISQHYIHTQQEKHWPIPNISSPLFSLFENIRELKLIFRVPSWSWPTVWYSRWLRISTRNYPILGITNWTNHTPITYKITNHACPEYFSLQPIQNEINLLVGWCHHLRYVILISSQKLHQIPHKRVLMLKHGTATIVNSHIQGQTLWKF